MQNATRISTLCALTAVCAILSGCPAGTDPPVTEEDMATGKNLKCTPEDTKNCGCLGSTVTGVKTCNADGVWSTCDGCDVVDTNDLSMTPASCTGCAGCCDNGVCVALASETNTQCGNNGQACESCGAGTCDKATGTCSTSMGGSCAATCAGCCNATGGCVLAKDTVWTACGGSGATCQKCAVQGGKCDAGMCTNKIDPKLTYQLAFRVIDFSDPAALSASGESNPDPFMRITFTDTNGATRTNVTHYCSSMKVCNLTRARGLIRRNQNDADDYSATNPPLQIPGSVLLAGAIKLDAEDYDTLDNDFVSAANLPAMTTLSYGTLLLYGPFGTGKVKIQYEVLWDIATMP